MIWLQDRPPPFTPSRAEADGADHDRQGDRFLTLQSQLLIAVWLGNGLCAQTGDGSDGGRGGG